MDRRHILDEARSGRCGERDRAAVLGLAIIRVVALGFLAFLVLLAPAVTVPVGGRVKTA